nr:RNA-directed DNA polymerase, eukaryota, reverse transcriptase zinc-binding domain protein [Tanacetum cinerariifolium]
MIGKILANRLSVVIDYLVSKEQSTFMKGRQILDEPCILNEIATWCKIRNEKAYVFNGPQVGRSSFFILVRFGDGEPTYYDSAGHGQKHASRYVLQMAMCTGCDHVKLPFGYLGLMVGENMTRGKAWKCVVDKVTSKLSNWKAKTLSIGGCLTLLKSVLGDICLGKSKVISVAEKMSRAGCNSSFRRMHRGGIESSQSEELVRILGSAILSSAEDRWRWSPLVPIKVNILAWRLAINKLATRVNLYNRWIKVNSMLCEVCDTGIESTYHLFFGYELAKELMVEVGNWWSLDIPSIDSFLNLQVWFQSLNMSKVKRDRLEVVFLTLWWHVWNFRNASLFAKKKPKRSLRMDNIVDYALLWINGRCKKMNLNWISWLQNLSLAISFVVGLVGVPK